MTLVLPVQDGPTPFSWFVIVKTIRWRWRWAHLSTSPPLKLSVLSLQRGVREVRTATRAEEKKNKILKLEDSWFCNMISIRTLFIYSALLIVVQGNFYMIDLYWWCLGISSRNAPANFVANMYIIIEFLEPFLLFFSKFPCSKRRDRTLFWRLAGWRISDKKGWLRKATNRWRCHEPLPT